MSKIIIGGAIGKVAGVNTEGLVGNFSHPIDLASVPLPSMNQFAIRTYPNERSRKRITDTRIEVSAKAGDLIVARLALEEEETGAWVRNPNRQSWRDPLDIPELRVVSAEVIKWGIYEAPQE